MSLEIVNQYRVGGVEYVQYAGKDRALWWPKGKPNPTDGTALDTDEIGDLAKKKADLYKQHEEIAEEIEAVTAELHTLETLKRQNIDR